VLTVELTGSCDIAGAQEQVSSDQSGIRLFQPADAASTATRWYLFPGGFTTREALRAALRRDSGGRLSWM
jgi:hypothetical protein